MTYASVGLPQHAALGMVGSRLATGHGGIGIHAAYSYTKYSYRQIKPCLEKNTRLITSSTK